MNDTTTAFIEDVWDDNKYHSLHITDDEIDGLTFCVDGEEYHYKYRPTFDTAIKSANWLKNWRR